MAIYKIFPTQDATMYSDKPNMNSGLDEILELRKNHNNVSRVLMKFDNIIEESSLLLAEDEYKVNLKLYIACATSLKSNMIINSHPLLQSWDNGIGHYNDDKINTSGVTWNKSDDYNEWININGGGYYNEDIISKFELKLNSTKDINMDITPIFNSWKDGNYGLILKLDDIIEDDLNDLFNPSLKYFSNNTHTIYPPHIELKWNDSKWNNLNNLPIVNDSDIFLGLNNNKGEFMEGSINKFRINVRPKYPKRVYQITSSYTENYILPENSCYAVKDLDTNEFIIDFDENYTKLSCDKDGNYFKLYMNGFQPERYYEVIIKTKINDEVLIINNRLFFKIKRNING